MEVQMVSQMLEELVLAAVDLGNQKELELSDEGVGHPQEDFSDFYLDKEELMGDVRRPRVESGFQDGSDEATPVKIPEKKHLDSGTGSFCSSSSSSNKSVAGSDKDECDLEVRIYY